MSLSLISRIILLTVLLLLLLTGLFPSPLMIGLTAAASSVLVLWQAYAILRDDGGSTPVRDQSLYRGYWRK